MAATGASAYQRLQVPKDGLAQSIQFWGARKADALGKMGDDLKAVEAAKQKMLDGFIKGLPNPTVQSTLTNIKSKDNVDTLYAQQASIQGAEIKRKAIEAWKSGDKVLARKYEDQMGRIKASFGAYNKLNDNIKLQVEEHAKNIDKYNPYDIDREKIQDALLKNNYMVFTDDEGQMKTVVGLDIDGDRVISAEEEAQGMKFLRGGSENLDAPKQFEILDPSKLYNRYYEQYKKHDLSAETGFIGEFAAGIGDVTRNKKTNAYEWTLTQGFDETKREGLKELIRAKMQDPSARAWIMNSYGITDKVDGFSPEELEKGINWMADRVVEKYPKKEIITTDSGKYATDAASRRAGRKEELETAGEAILVKDPDGQASQQLRGRFPESTAGRIKEFTTRNKADKPVRGILEDLPNAELLSVVIAEDGTIHGHYSSTTERTDTTKEERAAIDKALESGTTVSGREKVPTTVVDTRELTDGEVTNLSKFYKVDGREGLINYLQGVSGETPYGKFDPNRTDRVKTNRAEPKTSSSTTSVKAASGRTY